MNKNAILKSKGVGNKATCFLLSEYKIQIWKKRNRIKFENEDPNVESVINTIETNLRFYITHFLNK